MANFSPGWNFNPENRAEICCDYMTNFSLGWNISLCGKYEIAREESQENQNGTDNTNRENRHIASLTVWPFGGDQFSIFWDGNSLQDDGSETWLWLHNSQLEERKRRYLQDQSILILYLSFEIRESMNKILCFIALISLKSLLLPSGSHIVSCFSAWAEIPHWLHETFSDFQAR